MEFCNHACSGLNDVTLFCTDLNGESPRAEIWSAKGPWGGYHGEKGCGMGFFNGFQMSHDEGAGVKNVAFFCTRFDGSTRTLMVGNANHGIFEYPPRYCKEERMRICGEKLKIQKNQPVGNDHGLTRAKFACCRLPLFAILVAKDIIVKDGKNLARAAHLDKCAEQVAKDDNCKRTFYYSQDLRTCICVTTDDKKVYKAAHYFPDTNTNQYYLTMGLLKKRDQKEKDCVEKCMDIDAVNEATSKGCQEDCYFKDTTTLSSQSDTKAYKGGRIEVTSSTQVPSELELQSCSVLMPTGEYVNVVEKDAKDNSLTFFDTEGKRVKINEDNAERCEVIIHNVGPEDNGPWTFRTIYTDKSGYQVHPYEYDATVTVTEPDPPSNAYIEYVHVYPLLRKPKDKPRGYLELGIPNHPSDEERNYIKGVWTTDRTKAATSFEIKDATSTDDITQNICEKKTIKSMYEAKDHAKTVKLALEEKRMDFKLLANGEVEGWSCTGDLSDDCSGNQLFLCWQWKATEIGCFAKKNTIKAVGNLVRSRSGTYKIKNVVSEYDCQVKQCRITEYCAYFTYIADLHECYLKKDEVLDSQNINNYMMHSKDNRGIVFGPEQCIEDKCGDEGQRECGENLSHGTCIKENDLPNDPKEFRCLCKPDFYGAKCTKDYDCPEKADYEYTKVDDNVNANVEFIHETVSRPASDCRDDCDKEDKCDFFMFNYRKNRCIMWHFIRPSKVLQVGLTKDAIFCNKQRKYEENCRMGKRKDLQHVRTCEAGHRCVYASYAWDSVQEILNTTGKCIDNDSYKTCKDTCLVTKTCKNTGFEECTKYIDGIGTTTKQPQQNRQRRRIQKSNDEL